VHGTTAPIRYAPHSSLALLEWKSKSSVESVPACRVMDFWPPGWSERKDVTSYTTPCAESQQSVGESWSATSHGVYLPLRDWPAARGGAFPAHRSRHNAHPTCLPDAEAHVEACDADEEGPDAASRWADDDDDDVDAGDDKDVDVGEERGANGATNDEDDALRISGVFSPAPASAGRGASSIRAERPWTSSPGRHSVRLESRRNASEKRNPCAQRNRAAQMEMQMKIRLLSGRQSWVQVLDLCPPWDARKCDESAERALSLGPHSSALNFRRATLLTP
jgi:hypothetical protein